LCGRKLFFLKRQLALDHVQLIMLQGGRLLRLGGRSQRRISQSDAGADTDHANGRKGDRRPSRDLNSVGVCDIYGCGDE